MLDPQIYVCIVMEYCSNGDLKSYMEKQREGEYYLEADQVCRWMHQISAALSYCHAMGVSTETSKHTTCFCRQTLR